MVANSINLHRNQESTQNPEDNTKHSSCIQSSVHVIPRLKLVGNNVLKSGFDNSTCLVVLCLPNLREEYCESTIVRGVPIFMVFVGGKTMKFGS